jgi:hypothetical protein
MAPGGSSWHRWDGLLVERINDSSVTDDAAEQLSLLEIGAQLEGVPLAIELAVGRSAEAR